MGKLFGGLLGKLIGGIVATVMIGAGIYYSVKKKDELGGQFERPKHAIKIFDETYNVKLKDEFGKTFSEKLTVTAELDDEKNILYFGIYTQDYNRKDWSGTEKKLLPPNERHTGINHVYSKTFILHPPEVKVSKQEQRAFLVPKYSWDLNLKPYEEHKEAQLAIEGGEKLIDWALEQIPIPFFKDFIEKGIENATEKEEEYYEEMFSKIEAGYTATIIPSQIPNKIIGYTETARESEIHFDMIKTEGTVPIYLWARIALGDPSKSSYGSFPNKYGELENIVVKFNLEGEKEVILEEEIKRKQGHDFMKGVILFSSKNPLGQEEQEFSDIFVINEDRTGLKNLTNTPTKDEWSWLPWSPEGKKISYIEKDDRKNIYKMCIMNSDGTDKRYVPADWITIIHSWSPDSRKIVIHSTREGYSYIYNLVDNSLNRMAGTFPAFNIIWTSEGKILYDTGRGISVIDEKGGKLVRILGSNEWEEEYFKYEVNEFLKNKKNKHLRKKGWKYILENFLNLGDYSDKLLGWLPKEKKIIFKSKRPSKSEPNYNYKLYTADVRGENIEIYPNKFASELCKSFVLNFSLSPNGEKIVFSKDGIIYISDIDGTNKKELAYGENPSWQPVPDN